MNDLAVYKYNGFMQKKFKFLLCVFSIISDRNHKTFIVDIFSDAMWQPMFKSNMEFIATASFFFFD
jgi:hypothetical protein